MEQKEINAVFDRIYRRYDVMNHVFSLGIDYVWRAAAAETLVAGKSRKLKILDAGTGTGDMLLSAKHAADKHGIHVELYGIDPNRNMLGLAKEKLTRKRITAKLSLGDAQRMPYGDSSFDAVSSAFVLRNITDLDAFFSETYRVLKKRGSAVFIDMALPDEKPLRLFFSGYMKIIEYSGRILGRGSYEWLSHSIKHFDKKNLFKVAKKHGFKDISIDELATGISFMIICRK
jgi:demethylmenaquinone methyltransferase/2-methoxy-6-polyprenyl-1,4-benzoquinol methylase